MRSPNKRSNSANTSGLKAALPDTYRRKGGGRSSRDLASRTSRAYMVGTPKNIVNVVDLGGVEFAPQLGARPRKERTMRADHEAVRMKEWQGQKQVVVGGPTPGLAYGFDVGDEVAVQQHRTLAATRGPGGVGDHRQVPAARRPTLVVFGFSQKGVELFPDLDHGHQLGKICAHALQLWPSFLVGKAQTHARVVEDVPQLRLPVGGVYRHHHPACQVHTQVGRQKIRIVLEEERDTLPGS